MNTYEYRCEDCGDFEVHERFKKKPSATCPDCGKVTTDRLMSAPSVINMGPKTLGTLAEKNTRNMGTYELQAKEQAQVERREKAEQHVIDEGNRLGRKVVDKKKLKTPFWRKKNADKSHIKKLGKLNDKQKIDYINEGKLPS